MADLPFPLSDPVRANHLAGVIESSDDAIITKDLNSIVTSWNPGAERLFGFTADEAIGQSIRMIIPPELQHEEDMVLGRIARGERIDHYETTRQRKDGSRLQISLSVSPIRDAEGTIVGASKIARDITERVQLLARAEEHASTADRLAAVGAIVASTLDRETVVQKVTDAATSLTGAEFGAFFYNVVDVNSGDAYMLYTLSGAPREAFARFPHPRATQVFAPTFHGEGAVRSGDITRDARYGHSAPFFGMPPGHLPVRSYLAVPVRGPQGDVIGGLFFGHSAPDVFTDQHERLASGIASWATVALENARLYGEAQQASRLKDEFLAVLSHELRTPLNAILGYARLLRGGVLSGDKAVRGLETLERNATTLTQIVEDVLDVSRIVSGKMRLDIQPVDLARLIGNAVETVQPAADAKGVELQTIVDSQVGTIAADPERLQQVVWNMLANAVKFTPQGGRVQAGVALVQSHVEIAVSDTGSGIRPEFLPFVFEPFRQADSGLARKTGGLGLGLAIARHIVEMHGGTIAVESAGEGRGATFRVRLPLGAVHRRDQTPHAEPAAGVGRDPLAVLGDLRGIRVMAVDNEDDALTLLQVVLETAGAEVVGARSAQEALDQLSRRPADAIVADIGMPGMNGFDLIAHIRSSPDPVIRAIPAAALTAYARSDDRVRALESGYEMHLSKPVDPAELVRAVATLARRSKRA